MIELFDKLINDIGHPTREEIAEILRVSPELLAEFDAAYKRKCLSDGVSDNLYEVSAQEAASLRNDKGAEVPKELVDRIVWELLEKTDVWAFDGKKATAMKFASLVQPSEVTGEEIAALREDLRPQLTGSLMKADLNGPSYPLLLDFYRRYTDLMESGKAKEAIGYYHRFRQGLDILDLDDVTYAIIGMNPNTIGYWFPRMVEPVLKEGFFRIPATKIIKVPLTLLQLTRLDYFRLSPTTIRIVDEYCQKAFGLDTSKEYFIKTGTYSSKFDFRNAHVSGEKEVRELGEYLLYIHFQALSMAHYDLSDRGQPCIYGVSTTNEWCVREFVKDRHNMPTIYNGLPLRPEYRAFVDFDTKMVIGIHRYWDPDVMEKRFSQGSDADTAKMKHDYVSFRSCAGVLQRLFVENAPLVAKHLAEVLKHQDDMTGQWSVDIMQEGEEFWLIDMAQADISAFYEETVPAELRKKHKENWIPEKVFA